MKCLVLVGSETGTASDLGEVLHDRLRRRKNFEPKLMDFGKCSLDELRACGYVFVVCSTTGNGELPASTKPFWQQLLRKSLPKNTLSGLKVCTFGVGSSAYQRFNYAARKIHARLLQLGASEGAPLALGDEIGPVACEALFDEWMDAALKGSVVDVPDSVLLPPVYRLQESKQGEPESQTGLEVGLIEALVAENRRISDQQHFQDVRLLTLKTPFKDHEPGDVIVLYPKNDAKYVDMVIECQNWDPETVVELPSNYELRGERRLKLRKLLLDYLDLNAIPKRQFFVIAQHFCSSQNQSERMGEFAADLDDLFSYTTRPRRSLAEVILEFDSLKIPVEYILELLPQIRPRQYSIASRATQSGEIELAIALVKYRTLLRRVRRGLCSRYIERLEPGDHVLVSLKRNRLGLGERASTSSSPAVLVATGTGVAPIRALLQSVEFKTRPKLFLGCRNHQDLLFPDLEKVADVTYAFSQPESGDKRYVQHCISKASLSKQSFVMVGGSSGAMPRAVREAMGAAMNCSEADIDKKEKEGSYVEETW